MLSERKVSGFLKRHMSSLCLEIKSYVRTNTVNSSTPVLPGDWEKLGTV